MQIKLAKIFIAILFFLSSHVAFSTGIYKWKDSEGNIHYGDRTREPSAETIKVRAGPKPNPKAADKKAKSDRLLNVLKEDRKDKKSARMLTLKKKSEQKEKCSAAEKSLEQYRTAAYLYKTDNEGNRVILDDDEYALAIASAENSVDQFCG